jgi:hypothetical protein
MFSREPRPKADTSSAPHRVRETSAMTDALATRPSARTVCPCGGGCPRCAGRQAEQRLAGPSQDSQPVRQADHPPPALDFLHAKLAVGQANDRYEQEADRIADLVTGATYTIQGAPLPIEPYSGKPRSHMDVAPAGVNEALTNPGRPLEPVLRFDMERRLG